MINIGYLLGFFTALTQFKLIIGIPAFLVALFMLLRKARPRADVTRIALYLSLTIVWMLAIQILFGNRDPLAVLGALLGPTMFLTSTFLKVSERVIIDLFSALFAVFLMMIAFITFISTSLKQYRRNPRNIIYFTGAAMAVYTFIGFGYGTFFGSLNTTFPMALLCRSYRESLSEHLLVSARA